MMVEAKTGCFKNRDYSAGIYRYSSKYKIKNNQGYLPHSSEIIPAVRVRKVKRDRQLSSLNTAYHMLGVNFKGSDSHITVLCLTVRSIDD